MRPTMLDSFPKGARRLRVLCWCIYGINHPRSELRHTQTTPAQILTSAAPSFGAAGRQPTIVMEDRAAKAERARKQLYRHREIQRRKRQSLLLEPAPSAAESNAVSSYAPASPKAATHETLISHPKPQTQLQPQPALEAPTSSHVENPPSEPACEPAHFASELWSSDQPLEQTAAFDFVQPEETDASHGVKNQHQIPHPTEPAYTEPFNAPYSADDRSLPADHSDKPAAQLTNESETVQEAEPATGLFSSAYEPATDSDFLSSTRHSSLDLFHANPHLRNLYAPSPQRPKSMDNFAESFEASVDEPTVHDTQDEQPNHAASSLFATADSDKSGTPATTLDYAPAANESPQHEQAYSNDAYTYDDAYLQDDVYDHNNAYGQDGAFELDDPYEQDYAYGHDDAYSQNHVDAHEYYAPHNYGHDEPYTSAYTQDYAHDVYEATADPSSEYHPDGHVDDPATFELHDPHDALPTAQDFDPEHMLEPISEQSQESNTTPPSSSSPKLQHPNTDTKDAQHGSVDASGAPLGSGAASADHLFDQPLASTNDALFEMPASSTAPGDPPHVADQLFAENDMPSWDDDSDDKNVPSVAQEAPAYATSEPCTKRSATADSASEPVATASAPASSSYLDELRTQLSNMQLAHDATQTQLTSVQAEYKSCTDQLHTVTAKLEALQADYATLLAAHTSLKAERDDLSQQSASAAKEHNDQVAHLETELAKLQEASNASRERESQYIQTIQAFEEEQQRRQSENTLVPVSAAADQGLSSRVDEARRSLSGTHGRTHKRSATTSAAAPRLPPLAEQELSVQLPRRQPTDKPRMRRNPDMPASQQHQRKTSLSMLRARMSSDASDATPFTPSLPTRKLSIVQTGDDNIASSVQNRVDMARTQSNQFSQDALLFCSSCKGDLIIV